MVKLIIYSFKHDKVNLWSGSESSLLLGLLIEFDVFTKSMHDE